jgi:hypothetical protein
MASTQAHGVASPEAGRKKETQMATTTPDYPLRSITINWSESDSLEGGQTFNTLMAAEAAIFDARGNAPEGGAYHKTKLTVTLSDGSVFGLRMDLKSWKHEDNDQTIMGHAQECADWRQTEDYQHHCSQIQGRHEAETRAEATGFAYLATSLKLARLIDLIAMAS